MSEQQPAAAVDPAQRERHLPRNRKPGPDPQSAGQAEATTRVPQRPRQEARPWEDDLRQTQTQGQSTPREARAGDGDAAPGFTLSRARGRRPWSLARRRSRARRARTRSWSALGLVDI